MELLLQQNSRLYAICYERRVSSRRAVFIDLKFFLKIIILTSKSTSNLLMSSVAVFNRSSSICKNTITSHECQITLKAIYTNKLHLRTTSEMILNNIEFSTDKK